MGFATYLGIASSVFAEAKAIWLGLIFAQKLGIRRLWIESDSEAMVKCLNSSGISIWIIEYIINDILTIMKSFNFCQVSHILREGNSPADGHANWGVKNKSSCRFNSMLQLPKEIRGRLTMDRSRLPYFCTKKSHLCRKY